MSGSDDREFQRLTLRVFQVNLVQLTYAAQLCEGAYLQRGQCGHMFGGFEANVISFCSLKMLFNRNCLVPDYVAFKNIITSQLPT